MLGPQSTLTCSNTISPLGPTSDCTEVLTQRSRHMMARATKGSRAKSSRVNIPLILDLEPALCSSCFGSFGAGAATGEFGTLSFIRLRQPFCKFEGEATLLSQF